MSRCLHLTIRVRAITRLLNDVKMLMANVKYKTLTANVKNIIHAKMLTANVNDKTLYPRHLDSNEVQLQAYRCFITVNTIILYVEIQVIDFIFINIFVTFISTIAL